MRRFVQRSMAGTVAFAFLLSIFATTLARAQTVAVVRDAEIEALLKDYAEPIFRAAGLSQQNIQIVLVNDRSFNAFVDGRRIFINVGALLTAETPGEIIGVIAHEAGHIAGGHQQRLREQMARATILGVVGSFLGAGAIVAGSLSDSDGAAAAGLGMATASGGIAHRALLSYRRSEEMNADQAAMRYLNATGQSGAGMLETFERFSQGLALIGSSVDPYEQSHPLPRERIAQLEQLVRSSPYFDKPAPATLQMRHDLMRGKIAAHIGGAQAIQRAFQNDPNTIGARYGYAIASRLVGESGSALQRIEALIAEQPGNPYFYEVKGDILLRTGEAREAAAAYDRAARVGDSGIIRAQRGFALLRTGDPSMLDEAISDLRAAISIDPSNFNAYRQLSQAYGRAGDVGNAELVMAEGHFEAGNLRDAKIFAMRAREKLQQGTPAFTRANDIVTLGD